MEIMHAMETLRDPLCVRGESSKLKASKECRYCAANGESVLMVQDLLFVYRMSIATHADL